jgi:hypothetical protein
MPAEPLLFASVPGLLAGVALAAGAIVIAILRRPSASRATLWGVGIALALLALAAGRPAWNRPTEQKVCVMVDLSASTRTASYRDRATLDRRVRELLRDTPYEIRYFAAGEGKVEPAVARLPDLPGDHTSYAPPDAAAVLLFSDCRFTLPERSPPTYIAIDVGLDNPADAAVSKLEIVGDQLVASVTNSGTPRNVTLRAGRVATPTTAPAGSIVVSRSLPAEARTISAELSPGDPWPENDLLTAFRLPSEKYERWWISRARAVPGWRTMQPQELPHDPDAYLAPGVIVLDNLAATDFDDLQQRRLTQYVRDLGGGLVVLGGDRTFAAGGYTGSSIGQMSPLASDPPSPTNHWVLLADASGSMSTQAAGSTRWKFATQALAGLLPHLPPEDVATVGSFAESLQWWVTSKPVREASAIPLPPADAYPHGPTNLQPALEAIARSADGKMPVQLLVLSDFDTQITGVDDLAALIKSQNVHLSLLAIGDGTALPALRKISAATGGTTVTELEPTLWAGSAKQLAREAVSHLVSHEPVEVDFSPSTQVPPETVTLWNRTWLKESAVQLAGTSAAGEKIPMGASWNVGEGRVIALAFEPANPGRFVELAARPPHDPRFQLTWHAGSMLEVSIDAMADGAYLNGQKLTLELADAQSPEMRQFSRSIPQTGPGRYEAAVETPRSPSLATVRANGQTIGRFAVAGRYAPEFDAIGNDLSAIRKLAQQSGGEVFAPDRATPLQIHWPRRAVDITSLIAAIAGVAAALGLIAGNSRR